MQRRDALKLLGAGAVAPAASLLRPDAAAASAQGRPSRADDAAIIADRQRRMTWWHEARFGMFIHWGAYSVYGRHEWAMENEAIPVGQSRSSRSAFIPGPARPATSRGSRAGPGGSTW